MGIGERGITRRSLLTGAIGAAAAKGPGVGDPSRIDVTTIRV